MSTRKLVGQWRFYDAVGCDMCLETVEDDHVFAFDPPASSGENHCGGRACRACVKRIGRAAMSPPPKRKLVPVRE